MIKNTRILYKFEKNQLKVESLSYPEALKIFESLWQEANTLGILPSKDSMEGVEIKIKITKILKSCSKNS